MRTRTSRRPIGTRAGDARRPRAAASAASARAAAVLAALVFGCATSPPPPPDTDSTPETARSLPITGPAPDSLRCDDPSGPDCVDWFRFRPTGPGTIKIAVTLRLAEGEKAPAEPVPFELRVTDETGAELGRAVASSNAPVPTVGIVVRDPQAFLGSVSLPPGTGSRGYQLAFEAKIVSVPSSGAGAGSGAAAKSRAWTVLGVDAGGASETSILIDGGRRDGLRAGQRGRLVQGGRTLGRLVVVEVFEEGARARVEGGLAGRITADAIAEIEVSADSP